MVAATSSSQPPNLAFPRRLRLTHARQYQSVYGYKVRKPSGLLLVYAAPNGGIEHRLGLAIHRRVGTAVVRNRIKRLLREAFRLDRHGYPLLVNGGGADLIVQVKPHEPVEVDSYRKWLADAVSSAVREVSRREAKRGEASDREG
ncbi:MAG: ribonuclease P protein component [Planctomycetes bacterium]|nr:ribonuclease P protein component [Planctomycetota bacterium]